MPFVFGLLLVVLLRALVASAQAASQWCDSWTNVCFQRFYDSATDTAWGYAFPPTPRTEFIGIFTAPIRTGWVGASLGGGMRSAPLILSWMNGNTPVISVREYAPPPVMANGPRLTVLGTSGANATHQRIVYRCENCTSWTGGVGGINQNGQHIFGYATHGSAKPTTPANPASGISRHTLAAQHGVDTVAARSTTYDAELALLVGAPPLVPGGPPPIVTTVAPTTPIPPPITTTTPSTTVAPRPTQTLWGQCGGTGYSGPTVCPVGAVCKATNQFFSQCVPS